MARAKKGRAIDGIVVVNKPKGDSSNRVLQKVKHLFEAQKAGHTGNLDPMATGVLPICLGEATKYSQYLLDADKAYQATIKLGVQTTTGDAEGEVIEETESAFITEQDVLAILPSFVGKVAQVPPMYSALKHQGQPLYKLARQGIEVERKAREITIYSLQLNALRAGTFPELDITVSCSKGTYIRTLAEDIASRLGDLGGHLTQLHRHQSGIFSIAQAHSLEALLAKKESDGLAGLDALLAPAELAVNHLPVVEVSEKIAYHVQLGQTVVVETNLAPSLVRIRQENFGFIGVGEIDAQGKLAPKRLISM